MSMYVPPHLKREKEVELSDINSPAYQRASWNALRRTINGIMNRLTIHTVQLSCKELFRENIVRGRGLLTRSILNLQQASPDLSPVICAVVSAINKELPDIVLLLCHRLVDNWVRAHRRRDWLLLENASRFFGELYVFQVIEVDVVYQILIKLLQSEGKNEEEVDQAVKLFRFTFRAMSQRDRATFYQEVLTPFRDLLAMDDDTHRLSARSEALIDGCLADVKHWEKVKHDTPLIPPELELFDLSEQTHHDLDLEEPYDPQEGLNQFSLDPNFEENENRYEEVRKTILGEDWEDKMLEEAYVAESSDEEEHTSPKEDEDSHSGAPGPGPSTTTDHHTTINEEEKKVRKEVYLALRSSVRADEAAHKILRQMKPSTEKSICFMVVEGCCEEKFYRKLYAMTAERLCKSNARFQAFFIELFHTRYSMCDELSTTQIEYTAKIYSHLLRTDALYWSRILGGMDILHNNESQRLFMQYLFVNLCEEMGSKHVLERLMGDSELRMHLSKLYPLSVETRELERAINLYVAMEVGDLATPLRVELERRKSDRKRSRD